MQPGVSISRSPSDISLVTESIANIRQTAGNSKFQVVICNLDRLVRPTLLGGFDSVDVQIDLPVVNELDERGWINKLWHSKKGLPKGGRTFDKSSVHALLTNPIYCGKIKHKTDLYQGLHQALVDPDIFDRVQTQLRENDSNRGIRMPSKHGGLLKGLIRCPNCNVAMVHNMTKRNSIVYRYYTCVRAIKRGRQACKHPSLPAGEIEAAVVDQVRSISQDTQLRDEIKNVRNPRFFPTPT